MHLPLQPSPCTSIHMLQPGSLHLNNYNPRLESFLHALIMSSEELHCSLIACFLIWCTRTGSAWLMGAQQEHMNSVMHLHACLPPTALQHSAIMCDDMTSRTVRIRQTERNPCTGGKIWICRCTDMDQGQGCCKYQFRQRWGCRLPLHCSAIPLRCCCCSLYTSCTYMMSRFIVFARMS